MKQIRKTCLTLARGDREQVFEVILCDLGADAGERRYLVNTRYGRRGQSLREGTKTTLAVSLAEATRIFDSTVVAKLNQGYQDAARPDAAAASTDTAAQATADATLPPAAQRILQALQAAQAQAISAEEIRRAAWHAGELCLAAAVPALAALLQTGDARLDYCLAWALSRCGKAEDSDTCEPVLQNLLQEQGLNFAGRMAREALLAIGSRAGRAKLRQQIQAQLPDTLQNALGAAHDDIVTALRAQLADATPQTSALLMDCYALAREDRTLHQALVAMLPELPLAPNYFKGLRHLFKLAEAREDAEVWAHLAYRFERQPGNFSHNGWVYDRSRGRQVEFTTVMQQRDTDYAYSAATREYLRRRVWRYLRRLGRRGADDGYTALATALLLRFSDADAAAERHYRVYDERTQDNLWRSHDPDAAYVVFNHILLEHHPAYRLNSQGTAWYRSESDELPAQQRTEAFAELWDRHPERLVHLLTASRCAPVHTFAARALRANLDYCATLPSATVGTLLRQTYAPTTALGLDLAQALIQRNRVDGDLLLALLTCALPAARQAAMDVLDAQPRWFTEAPDLTLQAAASAYEDVRLWGRRALRHAAWSSSQQQAAVGRLISYALACDQALDAAGQAAVDNITWLLINVFDGQTRTLGFGVIGDLLAHPAGAVQAMGARLLNNHATAARDLPADFFSRLLGAEHAEVRALGVQLFAKLPDNVLLEQTELVARFALAPDAAIRDAARPILARLSNTRGDFAARIVPDLLGGLFRAEPVEGFHAWLLELLRGELSAGVHALDQATLWRLLRARSKGAQELGAYLLPRVPYTKLSVRQLARLGGHRLLAVRRWVWQGYERSVTRLQEQAEDALLLLDTDWDDSREFGFAFFQQHFTAQEWTSPRLVLLCDSVREDVQRYARDLISRYFAADQGMEYLAKLSEHPAGAVQLFASGLLEQHAGGDLARLRELEPYFLSVLGQVNQGRAAKTRVMRFLQTEAERSRETARWVADIFARQALTAAIDDRARCLEILTAIRRRFPDLPNPLTVKPVRRYGERA